MVTPVWLVALEAGAAGRGSEVPKQRAQGGDGAAKVAWTALGATLTAYTGLGGGGGVRRSEVKGRGRAWTRRSRGHDGRPEAIQTVWGMSSSSPSCLFPAQTHIFWSSITI